MVVLRQFGDDAVQEEGVVVLDRWDPSSGSRFHGERRVFGERRPKVIRSRHHEMHHPHSLHCHKMYAELHLPHKHMKF